MDLENRVREMRARRGMKQTILAEAAGVGQATVSDIENGRSIPGVDLALKLARVLDCTVEDLFRLKEG